MSISSQCCPAVPDYEMVRPIGDGAYGEVWLARNRATGIPRAIKIIRRSSFPQERPFQREFEGIRTFEQVSQSHPSQLALFHVGISEPDGCFYYVMELADSAPEGNLDDRRCTPVPDYLPHTLRYDLGKGRLTAARALDLGLQLSEALSHLHGRGLVHRDIKPSNIIFVNGRPKLADIGLVSTANRERSIVGTEGYLAPEGPGTPQADIYALGKVLYEALTGLDRRRFPELPAEMRNWPDAALAFELNAIVVRACSARLAERYASAEFLAEDLIQLEQGRSVKRRHAWRRNLRRIASASLGLAFLSALWLSTYWFTLQSGRNGGPGSKIPAANRAYTNGRSLLSTASQNAGQQAIELFKEAIRLDPSFGAAYAQLASAYFSLGGASNLVLGASAARDAVHYSPNLAKARTMLAGAKHFVDLDWAGAERERRYALRLGPVSGEILYDSALLLVGMGKRDEAVAEVEQALLADPRSLMDLRHAAHVFAWARCFDRAIDLYEGVIEKSPSSRQGLEPRLAWAYLGKGDYRQAIQHERDAALLRGEDPQRVSAEYGALEEAFAQRGAQGYWEQQLQLAHHHHASPMTLAGIYAQLEKEELAFRQLELARKETPVEFAAHIETDFNLDSLRAKPKFSQLVQELWRPH